MNGAELQNELVKRKYGLDSICLNDCVFVPLYQIMDKFEKLEKIERILSRKTGFSEEEKAYNYMMMVIDCKEVLNKEE